MKESAPSPLDPRFQTPLPTDWRKTRVALGIYLAVGAVIAFGANLAGLDANGTGLGGAYIILGPYGSLIDAVVGNDWGASIGFFLVESFVFLLLLLPALDMKSGCMPIVFLTGAVTVWVITGLLMEMLHSRWG